MFNLKESIETWKRGFYKDESFTKDDIDELESHLLDMIYDLEEKGYSKENAFKKASETLGSSEILSNDFNIVNKRNILIRRFVLCIIGFTLIEFMLQLIFMITGLVIIPLENILSNIEIFRIPLINPFLKLMYGQYNRVTQIAFIISITLGIGTIYLILSSKRNLISKLIDKIEYIYANKLIYKVGMFILLILTSFLPYFIRNILSNNMGLQTYGQLNRGLYLFEFIFRLTLSIGFIYKLNKSKRNNDFLWSICVYIIVVVFRNAIPIIVMLLTVLFGGSNPTIYGVMCIIIISSLVYLGVFINVKLNRYPINKFKNMLVGIVIIVSNFIYMLLAPFVTRYTTPETYGGVQYISSLIVFALVLIAQVIMNIMLIKRNKVKIV